MPRPHGVVVAAESEDAVLVAAGGAIESVAAGSIITVRLDVSFWPVNGA